MARPRYATGDPTARDRLIEAFWSLLGDRPYTKLSVVDVVRTARVNKNTFYYHYADLEELAHDAVEQTLDPEAMLAILTALSHPNAGLAPQVSPELTARVDRLGLIAGALGSPTLRGLLKDALHTVWTHVLHLDVDHLSVEQEVAVEFALGGILEVMAYRHASDRELDIATTARTIVASGMFEAFLRAARTPREKSAPGTRPAPTPRTSREAVDPTV